MKSLRGRGFLLVTIVIYLGVPLLGWGAGVLAGFFASAPRAAYAGVVLLFGLAVGLQAIEHPGGVRGLSGGVLFPPTVGRPPGPLCDGRVSRRPMGRASFRHPRLRNGVLLRGIPGKTVQPGGDPPGGSSAHYRRSLSVRSPSPLPRRRPSRRGPGASLPFLGRARALSPDPRDS